MVTNDTSVKAALTSGLKQVLEDESMIKLMHDCRRPAAAIRYQLQISLCNVFDTQVDLSYPHHVVQDSSTGTCFHSLRMSFLVSSSSGGRLLCNAPHYKSVPWNTQIGQALI